jgi:hypothetical protein
MGSVVFLVVFLYFGVVHQEIQAKGCALLRGGTPGLKIIPKMKPLISRQTNDQL